MADKAGYGETLGSEYYKYFGKFDYRGEGHIGEGDFRFQYTYYEGKMYYIKNGFIWKSNEDGTNPEVIRKIDSCTSIFVNACGIYIIVNKNKIMAYDFNGNEKAVIESYYEIRSYYICDNRVYLINCDENEEYSAVWFDIDTHRFHDIYTTEGKVNLGVNSDGLSSYKLISLNHIMANQKRVVMWMEFTYNYYTDNMDEDDLENQAGGWYSYDFETRKFRCINCMNIYPHTSVTSPQKFGKRRDEYQNQWISIVYFDMKQDVMWTRRNIKDGEVWEPRKIENNVGMKVLKNMSAWVVREKPLHLYRSYFDGRHRFWAEGTLVLYSYNQYGHVSSNLFHSGYQAAGNFQICGNYIFYVDDNLGNEKQFSLAQNPPCPLRSNWMQSHHPERFSDEEKMAIDSFLNGKKISDSVSALSRNIVKSNASKSESAKTTYLEYWESFVEYAFESSHNAVFQKANFSRSVPADRNWYALRFGTSKAHIELSFSIKKKTARTALFIRDKQKYEFLESNRGRINDTFQNVEGNIIWDGMSKLSSISIVRDFDISRSGPEQFEWFMECSSLLKTLSTLVV